MLSRTAVIAASAPGRQFASSTLFQVTLEQRAGSGGRLTKNATDMPTMISIADDDGDPLDTELIGCNASQHSRHQGAKILHQRLRSDHLPAECQRRTLQRDRA